MVSWVTQFRSLKAIGGLVRHTEHRGFPVTRNGLLLGYATRMQLLRALGEHWCVFTLFTNAQRKYHAETTELLDRDIPVVFVSRQRDDSEFLDFSALLEPPALLIRKEIPL